MLLYHDGARECENGWRWFGLWRREVDLTHPVVVVEVRRELSGSGIGTI